MQLAKIIGDAKSITKSDELYGSDILVAIPVDMETMQETGKPFLVADKLGAQEGQLVICASVCAFQIGDISLNTVLAIPEALRWNGKQYFSQTVETTQVHAEATQEKEQDLDPVSSLTAEFQALHQELDRLSADDSPKENTNTVPYEAYAKYLTTDFEPVDIPSSAENSSQETEQRKTGYSRVGLRSERKK